VTDVALGYDGRLYLLAFDHRGSFQRDMFGIVGDPSPEQIEAICDVKLLIFESALAAAARGPAAGSTGIAVDEQFGCDIPAQAREHAVKLVMPVEKSGQREFDFEYGEDFGAHIERCDPDFSKVLVRYNPEDEDRELNERQRARMKTLSDWLHARDRKLLFELLVPPTAAQVERVGGDSARYDLELRPNLVRAAIEELQNAGIEVDVWKLEGVQESADAAMLAEQARAGVGRAHVVCIVLGRAGSDEQIDHWLGVAAPVEGFAGFAIGRSVWWGALKGFLLQSLPRQQARDQIKSNYLRFIDVYERHQRH
jgi:myo-inositol catabolism protein IolC